MNILLNQIAVLIFLVANLIIGLQASRGIKTVGDYTGANKRLGLGVLIATLIATLFDAGNIGLKIGYQIGLTSLFYPLSLSFTAVFLGCFLFPRLVQFENQLTIADVMHTMYGAFARTITVIICTIFSVLVIGAQLTAFSSLSDMLDISPGYTICLFGLIITVYTSMGGIRSVAKTDVWQLIAIVIGIVCFFLAIITQAGGLNSLLGHVPANSSHLDFLTKENFVARIAIGFFWSIFPTMLIAPPTIQRILMTKDRKSVRHMFMSFAILYYFLRLLIVLASLGRFSVKETVESAKNVPLSFFITSLCQSELVQCLFLITILAIIMSTMDSFLNALGLLWIHDVAKPWYQRHKQNVDEIKSTRTVTFVLGILCTLFALSVYQSESMNFIGYATVLISPLVIPFLLGLAGLKGAPKIFKVSFLSFLLTVLIGFGLFKMKVDFVVKCIDFTQRKIYKQGFVGLFETNTFLILRILWLWAIPVSLLAFLSAHYLEYGTWKWVDREKDNWREKASYSMHSFFQWLYHPITWCNRKSERYGTRPFMVGFFTVMYCVFPYITQTTSSSMYLNIGLLRMVAIVLCCLMMVRKHWADIFKSYFSLFYYLTILYCYPFLTTFTVLSDPQGHVVLFYIAFGILLLGIMVDWNSFILLNLLGVTATLMANKWLTGIVCPSFGNNAGSPLFVSIFFPVLTVVLFVKYTREQNATYKAENDMLDKIKKNQLLTYEDSNQQVYQSLQKKSTMMQSLEQVASTLEVEGGHANEVLVITEAMNHFYSIAQRSQEYLKLNIKSVSLGHILDQAHKRLVQKGIEPEAIKRFIRKPITPHQKITCDPEHVVTLLTNAITYFPYEDIEERLSLFVDAAWIDYHLEKRYQQKPVQALRLTITTEKKASDVLQSYHPYDDTKRFDYLGHVNMLENKRIVSAHYGFIELKKEGHSMTQTYVLPIDLKAVRPKISQFASEDLDATQIDDPADKVFLKAVKKQGITLKRISLALKVAKHYHQHQTRNSGEPYYLHPMAVATVLLDYTKDEDTIVAALLHDTVEDTEYSMHQLTAMFGNNVARMVRQVTHLYNQKNRPKIKLGKSETLDRLIASDNQDSLMVKLADRLHNMQTLEHKARKKQVRIAKETLETFIPIAKKLKLKPIEKELKQLVDGILNQKSS